MPEALKRELDELREAMGKDAGGSGSFNCFQVGRLNLSQNPTHHYC